MSRSASDAVPRIVLDTNVCLDLFHFRDPRCASLAEALAAGMVRAVTRADCREEWQRVIEYPHVPIRPGQRAGLRERFDAQVALLDKLPSLQELPALPLCRDPDDQKFLQLTLASGAAWLLSKDRDLLKLNRRTRKAGMFTILKPEQWLPPTVGAGLQTCLPSAG